MPLSPTPEVAAPRDNEHKDNHGQDGRNRNDDRWGSRASSGEVFLDKDPLVVLINKMLSMTEQSERGHDEAEVECDGEELMVVWIVEALARD